MLLDNLRLLTLVLALMIPFGIWFGWTDQYLLWDISWYAVTALMLIRPLADIFQLPVLRRLIAYRKELGILSAIIIVSFSFVTYWNSPESFLATYFGTKHWTFSDYSLFARLGELTGFILLITSNKFSQTLLGSYWKRIQRLSYIYFFSGGIYILHLGKEVALYSMIVVAVLWWIAFVKVKIKNSNSSYER